MAPTMRIKFICVIYSFQSLGNLISGLLAYLIRDWIVLQLCLFVTMGTMTISYLYVTFVTWYNGGLFAPVQFSIFPAFYPSPLDGSRSRRGTQKLKRFTRRQPNSTRKRFLLICWLFRLKAKRSKQMELLQHKLLTIQIHWAQP